MNFFVICCIYSLPRRSSLREEGFFLTVGERAEHPVGKLHFGMGLFANAYFDAGKSICAEMLDDRAHTLLSSVRSLAAYAHNPDVKRDVVVDDKDVFGGDLIKIRRFAQSLTRIVHKGLGQHEKASFSAKGHVGAQGGKF